MEKNTNTNVAPTAVKDNTNTRTRVAPNANSNTNTGATNHQRANPPVAPPPSSASADGSTGASNSLSQSRDPPKRGRPRKDSGPTKPWVIGLPAPRAVAGLPPLYPPPMDSQAPAAPPVSQEPLASPASPIPPTSLFNAPLSRATKKDAPVPPVVSAQAPLVLGCSLPREVIATKVTRTHAHPAPVVPAPVLSDPVVPMVPTPAPVTRTPPVTFFLSSLVSANQDPLTPVSPDTETLTPPMSLFLEPPAPMFPLPPARESPLAKSEGPSVAPAEDRVRKRGRSEEEQKNIGTPTIEFKPHAITVPIGEDILEKIMSFTHEGHNSVCVLSATGSVSSATIGQLTVDLNMCAIYEGFYDIVRLNGAYIMNEMNGYTHRMGGLTVTLANIEGTLFGGKVTGPLIAASGVQLVLGTFSEGDNPSRDVTAPPAAVAVVAATAAIAGANAATTATFGGVGGVGGAGGAASRGGGGASDAGTGTTAGGVE
ncbi:hypothetical protein J5N97_005472 [Dioscorea zingiberensis]|uniref:AT-hook motif nuclear-localized protein n=1 Tax=Dioscorea zingiberensis TaxID=325984 RepID=A0A9D5D8L1_9LILI|nr:hypothetical protein J5N97_005472 [Dioscorea zingiberensis]